jgi:hypothetical protein
MKSINVTDAEKDEFRYKKQALADMMGVDIHEISDTDALHWLCQNIPASRKEQLNKTVDKFKEKLTTVMGPRRDQKALHDLIEDFRYILQKIQEDPEETRPFDDEVKVAIDRVKEKFPPSAFPIKKRTDNDTDERSAMDKQG